MSLAEAQPSLERKGLPSILALRGGSSIENEDEEVDEGKWKRRRLASGSVTLSSIEGESEAGAGRLRERKTAGKSAKDKLSENVSTLVAEAPVGRSAAVADPRAGDTRSIAMKAKILQGDTVRTASCHPPLSAARISADFCSHLFSFKTCALCSTRPCALC